MRKWETPQGLWEHQLSPYSPLWFRAIRGSFPPLSDISCHSCFQTSGSSGSRLASFAWPERPRGHDWNVQEELNSLVDTLTCKATSQRLSFPFVKEPCPNILKHQLLALCPCSKGSCLAVQDSLNNSINHCGQGFTMYLCNAWDNVDLMLTGASRHGYSINFKKLHTL